MYNQNIYKKEQELMNYKQGELRKSRNYDFSIRSSEYYQQPNIPVEYDYVPSQKSRETQYQSRVSGNLYQLMGSRTSDIFYSVEDYRQKCQLLMEKHKILQKELKYKDQQLDELRSRIDGLEFLVKQSQDERKWSQGKIMEKIAPNLEAGGRLTFDQNYVNELLTHYDISFVAQLNFRGKNDTSAQKIKENIVVQNIQTTERLRRFLRMMLSKEQECSPYEQLIGALEKKQHQQNQRICVLVPKKEQEDLDTKELVSDEQYEIKLTKNGTLSQSQLSTEKSTGLINSQVEHNPSTHYSHEQQSRNQRNQHKLSRNIQCTSSKVSEGKVRGLKKPRDELEAYILRCNKDKIAIASLTDEVNFYRNRLEDLEEEIDRKNKNSILTREDVHHNISSKKQVVASKIKTQKASSLQTAAARHVRVSHPQVDPPEKYQEQEDQQPSSSQSKCIQVVSWGDQDQVQPQKYQKMTPASGKNILLKPKNAISSLKYSELMFGSCLDRYSSLLDFR